MDEVKTVGEDILNELDRVIQLEAQYLALPPGVGTIAASMMRVSINNAKQAIASGDVIKVLTAYEDLKGYE